jgi:hypothetical protein
MTPERRSDRVAAEELVERREILGRERMLHPFLLVLIGAKLVENLLRPRRDRKSEIDQRTRRVEEGFPLSVRRFVIYIGKCE